MFSLKSVLGLRVNAVHQPRTAMSDAFIVPKLLRRPLRMLSRLDTLEARLPRFAMSGLTIGLLSASCAYGAYEGGHMPEIMQSITARTGFAVTDIRVSGERETSEIDVLGELQLDGWTSLVGFNADQARERLTNLPWVQNAEIRKIYPDTLEVAIAERSPFAVWQHGERLTVIEKSGRPIVPFDGRGRSELPLVIGLGGPEKVATFMEEIAAYPQLTSQVKAYVRIADRRWDLLLANGITIKLPEMGVDDAIREVLDLDARKKLLSRDISIVDLRFADRIVVRLTESGTEQRLAKLEADKKAARKAGKRI